MRIDEFIDASNKSDSVDSLFEIYKKAMANLGFDRVIFSLMTDHVAIDRPAGHGIMLNYSEDWMKFYVEKRFDVIDPVRRNMYSADTAFVWKEMLLLPHLTRTQVNFMKQGEDAGLNDGIGIPLRGPRGAIAGIGAASSSGGVEINKNSLSYANLLAQQFYTVFLDIERRRLNRLETEQDMILLSDREQEILQWCSRGKTKWEISQILNISTHTVDFHTRNCLKKLDANSVALAILKALNMGLIQL